MKREGNILIISIVITAILIISTISFIVIKSNNNSNETKFAEELANYEKTQGASSQIGKSIEETENNLNFENIQNIEKTEITTSLSDIEEEKNEEETNTEKVDVPVEKTKKNKTTETSTSVKKEENKKEENKKEENKTVETNLSEEKIKFIIPIKGEIIREFAKDSLVFSKTLEEWITHNGVDIKADETNVVKAAESGTVSAIKNDPRYGLTVIINHDNGYQTIYSNLLTAEFVVKGEKVEKGQSIATVGKTAAFESLDESHLHFELLKDNEYQDPTIYINFK